MDRTPHLKDGCEWAEHEDCIIGNEDGLNALMNACAKALENGEYHGADLGDYMGVKMLPDSWFGKNEPPPSTTFERIFGATAVVTLYFRCTRGLPKAGL